MNTRVSSNIKVRFRSKCIVRAMCFHSCVLPLPHVVCSSEACSDLSTKSYMYEVSCVDLTPLHVRATRAGMLIDVECLGAIVKTKKRVSALFGVNSCARPPSSPSAKSVNQACDDRASISTCKSSPNLRTTSKVLSPPRCRPWLCPAQSSSRNPPCTPARKSTACNS
jgi:hypothetical protein